jgi:hypothetical protein
VRRTLYRPAPLGTILDDVYWPLCVAMSGHRVVHDRNALAYDRLPCKARQEFIRKVRTLSGNFQLAARLPEALVPWRNPIWYQFLSHKLLRLAVPWALLCVLGLSLILAGPLYKGLAIAQIAFYALALLGLLAGDTLRARIVTVPASFVLLNLAAAYALWIWARGESESTWRKVDYTTP